MSALGNAAGLSLENVENQDLVLDALAKTMKEGVIPSGDELASNIAKAAPTMAALTQGSDNAILSLSAMSAMLTQNGVSLAEAQTQIKALGGSTGSSVTQKTTYLVVGTDPGSKLARAQELGTKLLTEEELLRLLEQTT